MTFYGQNQDWRRKVTTTIIKKDDGEPGWTLVSNKSKWHPGLPQWWKNQMFTLLYHMYLSTYYCKYECEKQFMTTKKKRAKNSLETESFNDIFIKVNIKIKCKLKNVARKPIIIENRPA